jgi:hypothetical protein
MNQDVMFFVITSLIVVALAVIGPGLVVWQYQRGGTSAARGKRTASPPMVGTSLADPGQIGASKTQGPGQFDDGPSTRHRETSD